MRRAILTALAVVSGGVFSAVVPQTSAEDYFFSRPNLPSNIVGRVIGDPPAYHVMRSEDVAWLREAYAERAAIMGGFAYTWNGLPQITTYAMHEGKWPLSYTNRFAKWTTATEPSQGGGLATNIIVGYSIVTNLGVGADSAQIKKVTIWGEDEGLMNTNNYELGYLTPDDRAYVENARAWLRDGADWGRTEITNVSDVTRLVPAWSNRTTEITMTMTNGTTSVFTNSWRVFAPTSVTERVTNIVGRGHGIVSLIFTNRVIEGYNRIQPPPLRGPYDSRAITNHYAFLRGLTRLARPPGYLTNSWLSVYEEYYDQATYTESEYNFEDSWSGTNSPVHLPFVEVRHSVGEGKRYVLKPGATFQDDDTWELSSSESKSWSRKYASGTATFKLDSPRLAVIPDGENISIKRARLYALANAEYTEHDYAGTTAIDDFGRSSSTSLEWTVCVPVGDVTIHADAETNLVFDASLNMGVLNAAWGACGAPSAIPSGRSFPSLRYACPSPSHGDNIEETTDASAESSRKYEVKVTGLLLLLDFAPRASLPDW